MITRLTTRPPSANTARLDFDPDELLDGRAPIAMIQYKAIYHFTYYVHAAMTAEGKTFVISNNLPVRPYSDNLRLSLAPDLLFAYVEDPASFLSETGYNIWKVGKPPDLVLEVASPSTHRKDLDEKPDIYAGMGIPEYWMFDPTGGELYGQALIGYKLIGDGYVPIDIALNKDGLLSGYSEVWGMRLCSLEKQQRERVLKKQPFFVFYEDFQAAELLLQDVKTGLYALNQDSVSAERQAEREGMQAEREEMQVEREGMQMEREEMQVEREGIQVEREGMQMEREEMQVEREGIQVEREGMQMEREEMEEAEAKLNTAIAERDARIRELEEENRRIRVSREL